MTFAKSLTKPAGGGIVPAPGQERARGSRPGRRERDRTAGRRNGRVVEGGSEQWNLTGYDDEGLSACRDGSSARRRHIGIRSPRGSRDGLRPLPHTQILSMEVSSGGPMTVRGWLCRRRRMRRPRSRPTPRRCRARRARRGSCSASCGRPTGQPIVEGAMIEIGAATRAHGLPRTLHDQRHAARLAHPHRQAPRIHRR